MGAGRFASAQRHDQRRPRAFGRDEFLPRLDQRRRAAVADCGYPP